MCQGQKNTYAHITQILSLVAGTPSHMPSQRLAGLQPGFQGNGHPDASYCYQKSIDPYLVAEDAKLP